MRLILGTRNKVEAVGGGAFFCPACKSQTNYARVRLARYFTFFFIPLFRIRTIQEYIQCAACHAELRPEVAALTRAQVEQITAPWTCPACGNKNSATEKACVSCGAARSAAPPPMPGQPNLPAAAAITRPPPLGAAGPVKKRSALGTIFLVLGCLFGFYIISAVALNIWARNYRKNHPERFVKKPGEHEFEVASKTIANDLDGVTHGNTPAAQELAAKLSEALALVHEKAFTNIKPDITDGTSGKFLVYCQLNPDSCVFLVHVPNLRNFESDAKKTMADLCYVSACLVLKSSASAEGIQRVAVATRGAILYDTALIGSYPPQKSASLDNLEKLETEAWDVPGLHPFFTIEVSVPEAVPKKLTAPPPSTPIARARLAEPTTPSTASTPAPPAASVPSDPSPAPEKPAAARPVVSRSVPSWVPIYPALARPAFETQRENNGLAKGMASLETADPLDKVKEFYEDKLKTDGFEITDDKATKGIFEGAKIEGRKGDGNLSLHITIKQMRARTTIVITYEGAD